MFEKYSWKSDILSKYAGQSGLKYFVTIIKILH